VLHGKAPAKINLSLEITGKRPDGYHDLKTVMASVSLYDELTVALTPCPDGEESFSAKTTGAELPKDDGNLAVRAARLFMESAGITGRSIHIDIVKNIPVSAGLGGGSSDAAAVLRVLNGWRKHPSLHETALRLGSDVPYCLHGGVCLAAGRGEILTPLPPLPYCWIVLCTPPVAVSTAEMFAKFDKLSDEKLALGAFLDNIFEIVEPLPHVAEIKGFLLGEGAEKAGMSGSGPTVFGIFTTQTCAKSAQDKLRANFPKTYLAKWV
jgi:4-diphosphocytidyl-2-C-methyl-D-erythritol kinase